MIYEARVDGRSFRVEVRAGTEEGRLTVVIDGRPMDVDVREAGPHQASLIVHGRSYEPGLERRARGSRGALGGRVLEVELSEAARGEAAPRRPAGGPAR